MARGSKKEHGSIEELLAAVNEDAQASIVNEVLMQDVAPIVEEMLLSHIQHDIYDAYTPVERGWFHNQTYPRRWTLLRRENLRSWILEDGVLAVTSTAVPDGPVSKHYNKSFYDMETGGFLAMLENGNMGFWSRMKGPLPRPALSRAQSEVDASQISGRIKHAIDNGIKRRLT